MTEPSAGRGVELSSAFASTLSVLRKVGPRDLDRPTPCASWDVQALINHIISAARWWAATVSGDASLEAGEDADYVGSHGDGGFVAAYEESIRVALDAFAADGAAERMVTVAFGEFPGAALAQFAATGYLRDDRGRYQPYGVVVLEVVGDHIRRIVSFGDPRLLPVFGFENAALDLDR
ncbi:maleylpyruvate isomerase N-terminal domain-containing protein [Catenulispora pinisilvae]|uniref:maleylpyruvate isomerase N-terminal domain-containing protein n=1 Tax=Catenulispora pinisilvae TaxID=2705253 RepID=UPI0018925640|nr:maleylpyruvate isomerase N-terminal domain-containing protein [Catenulispora pinisilvae]